MVFRSLGWSFHAACGAALLGCSDLPPPPIGQLHLGLSSGIGEAEYKLVNASFAIDGSAQLTLDSEDEPESDTLQRALPAGQYTVTLLDGWQLERIGDLGNQVVPAELSSNNPLEFAISPGELTTLTFQFTTGSGAAPAVGEGQLRVAIEVDGQSAPHVVISELMKNPEVMPDAEGEWLELYNAGAQAVDLGGCTLGRDEQELELEGDFTIEPGGYLTFSNGDAPGFMPDVLYRGITLPNTGSFVVRIACGGRLLDEVGIDAALLPNRAGRSLSLSGSSLDNAENDLALRWCEGVTAYNGDFGTPGAGNPGCTP